MSSSLFETTLTEQTARNAAALAAIHARVDDIYEAQRLVETLGARGARIRATVDTVPLIDLATCRISLWITATPLQWAEIELWFSASEIAIARLPEYDVGELSVYEAQLRSFKMRLNLCLERPRKPLRFRFDPTMAPEAA